jgi:hypothetical protein
MKDMLTDATIGFANPVVRLKICQADDTTVSIVEESRVLITFLLLVVRSGTIAPVRTGRNGGWPTLAVTGTARAYHRLITGVGVFRGGSIPISLNESNFDELFPPLQYFVIGGGRLERNFFACALCGRESNPHAQDGE